MLLAGLDEQLYLGAAAAVVSSPRGVIWSLTCGSTSPDEAWPVDAGTLWDLASLTKPMATAASVLLLASEGAFHLGEELRTHLTGAGESLSGITIRHCLTHTSGLPAWKRLYGRGDSPDAILDRVRHSERERPVGGGYAYSDLGYILLGDLVRQTSGFSLEEFAATRIFSPLRMEDTGYRPVVAESRIAPTRCPDRDRLLRGEVHDGNCDALGGVAGHAGLFSSLNDVVRFAEMVLGGGRLGSVRVLPELVVRAMGRNHNPPGMNGHGLGWFCPPGGFYHGADFFPPDGYGHTGFTGTSILFCPSAGVAVVLLTNRVYWEQDGARFNRFRRRFHNTVAAAIEGLA